MRTDVRHLWPMEKPDRCGRQQEKPQLRTPDAGLRTLGARGWILGALLASLFLGWSTVMGAQDEVAVPPLEAGVFLTFHPICVHFAIALTVFGLAFDWLGSLRAQACWQHTGRFSFFAGIVAIGLAVISGWIEQELPRPASAFDAQIERVLFLHEYLGYGLLGVFVILAIARLRIPDRLPALFVILSGLGLAGLLVQGYLGGELVYRYGAGVRAVQILSRQRADGGQKKAPEQPSGALPREE